MSEAVPAPEYTDDEHAALASMADALARFGHAIRDCEAVGIDLPTALTACGIPVPSWAGPFIARMSTPVG